VQALHLLQEHHVGGRSPATCRAGRGRTGAVLNCENPLWIVVGDDLEFFPFSWSVVVSGPVFSAGDFSIAAGARRLIWQLVRARAAAFSRFHAPSR